jgi:hypothetical protein
LFTTVGDDSMSDSKSDSDSKNADLWDEIPAYTYIGLGQRGRERLSNDQCFLPGCNNTNRDDLEPYEKSTFSSPKDDQGNNYDCTKIKVKCKKCGRTYQYAMKTINAVFKKDDKMEVSPFVGMVYILDENGKNLGFLGYF